MTPRASPGLALRPKVPATEPSMARQATPAGAWVDEVEPGARLAVGRFALGEPVKTRVSGQAGCGFAMGGTKALEPDLGNEPAGAPDLGGAGHMAYGAAGGGVLQ